MISADGKTVGKVTDLWIDRGEMLMRYLEVLLDSGRSVLAPATMARVRGDHHQVVVKALTAAQFADVPGLNAANQVTRREEDRISGYFGGGYLYAYPARAEPLI